MMKFIPKKTLYKKYQKGKKSNRIAKYITLQSFHNFSYSLISIKPTYITSKQIFTLFQTLNKYIKKSGKIVIKIFAHQPKSKKPIEVRMGKGKGSNYSWIAKIKAGTCVCIIQSLYKLKALKALKVAQKKLPFITKIC